MTKQEKIDQLVELLLLEFSPEDAQKDEIIQQTYQKAKSLVHRGITAENF
jgi:hypothetical protein